MQAEVLFGRYVREANLNNMPINRRSTTKTGLPKANSLQEPPGGICRSNNLSSQKTDDFQRYPT